MIIGKEMFQLIKKAAAQLAQLNDLGWNFEAASLVQRQLAATLLQSHGREDRATGVRVRIQRE